MASETVRHTLQDMMTYRGLGIIAWNNKFTIGTVQNKQIHIVRSINERVLSSIQPNSIVVHVNRNKTKHDTIEFFHIDELQFTLVHHPSVPFHRLVDPNETETLKVKFGQFDHFPILPKDDPVVRFYGWQVGQIIHVNEKYRIIV